MNQSKLLVIALALFDGPMVHAEEGPTKEIRAGAAAFAGSKAPNSPVPTAESAPTLENMDADRNGSVSKDEFVAFHTSRLGVYFSALDKDRSATLTKEELIVTVRRATVASPRPPGAKPSTFVRPSDLAAPQRIHPGEVGKQPAAPSPSPKGK